MSARTPLPTSWGRYPEGRIFRVKLRSSSFSSVLCCSRNPVVIKTNRLSAEMIPSTACTRRDHGRRRVLEHNFAGASSGTTAGEVRISVPLFSREGSPVFLQTVCINDAHPPIDYLMPKQKLYLSCKSFSTARSLPIAEISFQPLCSEWSQIPPGRLQSKVERRQISKQTKPVVFLLSNLPAKKCGRL